jgi:hypothetical protein
VPDGAEGAASAAKEGFGDVVKVIGEYVAPLVLGAIGFFVTYNSLIGGPWTVANAIYVGSGNKFQYGVQVGGLVFAGVYGLPAVAMLAHDGKEGTWRMYMSRNLGALLGGMSLGSVAYAVANKPIQGPLDSAILTFEKSL